MEINENQWNYKRAVKNQQKNYEKSNENSDQQLDKTQGFQCKRSIHKQKLILKHLSILLLNIECAPGIWYQS